MAIDMFMRIEGIAGECVDEQHEKWISCLSYSHALSQSLADPGATGRNESGRVRFSQFTVQKYIDAATPDLNIYCASGKAIPRLELEICQCTGDRLCLMKYTLDDVIVSGVGTSCTDAPERPMEEVSFSCGRLAWEYTRYNDAGFVEGTINRAWNIAINKQEQ